MGCPMTQWKDLAALALAAGLAWPAEAQTARGNATPASIDPQASKQVEQFLNAHGYAKPLMLFTDPNCWTGTASRNGKILYVELHRDGSIVER